MKIVFDIGHPGHVHHFKHAIKALMHKGHRVLILARPKDVTLRLLEAEGLRAIVVGGHSTNHVKKGFNQGFSHLKTVLICARFRPDILVGRASPNLGFASFLLGIPFISFNDTEHAHMNALYAALFSDYRITPLPFRRNLGRKHLRIDSLFELAYLNPKYFEPDPKVLNLLGIRSNDTFIIMRIVAWGATHDVGYTGLSPAMKTRAIHELSQYGKVFISSEAKLPEDLKPYQLKIPPEKLVDALSYATMFFGEGGTVAAEAAVLGTVAVKVGVAALNMGNFIELAKYGLMHVIPDEERALNKTIELLKDKDLKTKNKKRRTRLLTEKIDVTAFTVWFIENYPKSASVIKKEPDYQYRFR